MMFQARLSSHAITSFDAPMKRKLVSNYLPLIVKFKQLIGPRVGMTVAVTFIYKREHCVNVES